PTQIQQSAIRQTFTSRRLVTCLAFRQSALSRHSQKTFGIIVSAKVFYLSDAVSVGPRRVPLCPVPNAASFSLGSRIPWVLSARTTSWLFSITPSGGLTNQGIPWAIF